MCPPGDKRATLPRGVLSNFEDIRWQHKPRYRTPGPPRRHSVGKNLLAEAAAEAPAVKPTTPLRERQRGEGNAQTGEADGTCQARASGLHHGYTVPLRDESWPDGLLVARTPR